MAELFATTVDLAQRWRPLGESEEQRAGTLLTDASALIRARVPGIDTLIDAGELDPDVPRHIACAMVQRAMQTDLDTPSVTQASESFAGFQYSNTFANPTGDLYLTSQDLKALRRPQASMIDLMPNPGHARH